MGPAMDVNDDKVAPWKGWEVLEELGCMKDVTTATGRTVLGGLVVCLLSFLKCRGRCKTRCGTTFSRDFEAVLVKSWSY